MKALILSLIVLLPSSAAARAEVLVGYAEADITPELGGSIPGYFRERLSTGVLDPLLAKALALTEDQTTLIIIALDLIGLQAPEVSEVRHAIRLRTGIAQENVFVHSTHTHTGAETPLRFTSDDEKIYPGLFPGEVDRKWAARLPERIAAAAEKALSNRVSESGITMGIGREDSIAFYRRYLMRDGTINTNPGRGNSKIIRPAGEIDPTVYVLTFKRAKTLLVSYGLHPDCIGGTEYSADYPYHLTQTVRASLGKEWNVLYLNAACGNINHVDVKNPGQLRGYEESRRIGQTLGRAVLAAQHRGEEFKIDRLSARIETVQCALRQVPDDIAARAELEVRAGGVPARYNFNELFAPAAQVLSKTKDRFHPAEIIVFRIGSLALVGFPAEVFVEIGREIKQQSPVQHTLIIGLTGGAMGYMPHAEGYRQGGYEAGYRSARYQPSTPTLWIETALDLLRQMR